MKQLHIKIYKYIYIRFRCILEELLAKNRLLAVFPRLGKEWIVSFTLRLSTLSAPTVFCSVIHLTQNGNFGAYGDRNPAVMMERDGSLYKHISYLTGRNGNRNFQIAKMTVPEANEPINIEIHQRYSSEGEYRVFLIVNGQEIKSRINDDARQFEKVKVYVGSPWYEACPGYIKNLAVTNFT